MIKCFHLKYVCRYEYIECMSTRMVWFNATNGYYLSFRNDNFSFCLGELAKGWVCLSKTNWKMQTFYDYINIMIYSNTNDILFEIVDILNNFLSNQGLFPFKTLSKRWWIRSCLMVLSSLDDWKNCLHCFIKQPKCAQTFTALKTEVKLKNKRNVKYHRHYFVGTLQARFFAREQKNRCAFLVECPA